MMTDFRASMRTRHPDKTSRHCQLSLPCEVGQLVPFSQLVPFLGPREPARSLGDSQEPVVRERNNIFERLLRNIRGSKENINKP
jgi:hypothetical protein